jgi:predicted lysophospholipase L1 biosynthesis ABC-type transport system permease subunit
LSARRWGSTWRGSTARRCGTSKIIGLFGGGLAGLFAVGIFTRRATATGAIVGFLGSAVVLYVVKSYTPVHFVLYPTIGVAACFLIGYVVSALIPWGRRRVDGLTIYTLRVARSDKSP